MATINKIISVFILLMLLEGCQKEFSKERKWMDELRLIDIDYKTSTKSQLIQRLENCSNSGNQYCSSMLGSIYYNMGMNAKAYEFYIKSQGILKTEDGYDWAPSEYGLGKISENGLYFPKDEKDAISHYKLCASTGVLQCSFAIANIYRRNADESKAEGLLYLYRENLMNAYTWTVISNGMYYDGENLLRVFYSDGIPESMDEYINRIRSILSKKDIDQSLRNSSEIYQKIKYGNPIQRYSQLLQGSVTSYI